MSCNDKNTPPTLVLDRVEGTTPCPGTADTQCPIDACCNYFKYLQEADGYSFILSGGGPFHVVDPICDLVGPGEFPDVNCPPPDLDGFPNLFYLQPLLGYADPGPLDSVICLKNMVPGTYKVCARWTMRNGSVGARAVALFRKDCTIADEICIADCSIPCPSDNELIAWPDQPPYDITCYDCLYITIDTCNPGVRFLAAQGCVGDTPYAASIENLQITVSRISNRDLETCGGIELPFCIMPECSGPPELLSVTPPDGATNYGGVDVTFIFNGYVQVQTAPEVDELGITTVPCDTPGTPLTVPYTVVHAFGQTTIVLSPAPLWAPSRKVLATVQCINPCGSTIATTCFTSAGV